MIEHIHRNYTGNTLEDADISLYTGSPAQNQDDCILSRKTEFVRAQDLPVFGGHKLGFFLYSIEMKCSGIFLVPSHHQTISHYLESTQ